MSVKSLSSSFSQWSMAFCEQSFAFASLGEQRALFELRVEHGEVEVGDAVVDVWVPLEDVVCFEQVEQCFALFADELPQTALVVADGEEALQEDVGLGLDEFEAVLEDFGGLLEHLLLHEEHCDFVDLLDESGELSEELLGVLRCDLGQQVDAWVMRVYTGRPSRRRESSRAS